jgi:hypothetical protein
MENFNPVFTDSSIKTFVEGEIAKGLDYVRSTRKCPKLKDEDFIMTNIVRVMGESKSGRSFIQSHRERDEAECDFAPYYEALHSERRLEMLREFHDGFMKTTQATAVLKGIDYLAAFPELKDRMVIAADGHYHEHASHAKRTQSGSLLAPGTIYVQDTHTGMITPLIQTQTEGKKHHEIKMLRKHLPSLNKGFDKKPIVMYDLAIQDNAFFMEMKHSRKSGIDIITKLKSNIKFTLYQPVEFNRSLAINTGITGVYFAGLNNAGTMRVIHYVNPEDGAEYKFITTIDDLEPGLIAWLYLKRWDIEKTYDVKKNKLNEKKAWATGEVAHEMQDLFVAITMNLLRLILALLESEFGIREEKLERKRTVWIKAREKKAKKKNRYLHPLVKTAQHMYQLSRQFIDCVRNHFFKEKTFKQLLPAFAENLKYYLGT